jgi:hypothetical protein
MIECLAGPCGLVHDNASILKIAAEFYRELFKKEGRGEVFLNEDFWERGDMVSEIEREALVALFLKRILRKLSLAAILRALLALMGFLFSFIKNSGM